LLINALDLQHSPVLSRAFDYVPSREPKLLPLPIAQTPWSEDGVLVGPIPSAEEIGLYGMAERIEQVAQQLVMLLPGS
jgi:hypothetical protein